MIFLSGSTFLGGDVFTLPCTPTNIDHINKVEIYNARVDEFYVTHDTDEYMIEQNKIPDTWDFYTVMSASFNNDTTAGNVSWHLDDLEYIIIKVKPSDGYKWITSHIKPVKTYQDLSIVGKYLAAINGTWDVALVPITSGMMEGLYTQTKVDVEVGRLVIMDADAIHGTFLMDSDVSIQSVMPSQAVNTLHNKFPYIIRNTRANYETVDVTCTFLPNDEDCLNQSSDVKAQAKWSKELKGWLMNGKTKLLKTPDGDMWLGYITTPVSDQPYDQGVGELRKYSFGLTETGLPDKEEDLFDAGILDQSVTSVWWADA